MESVEEREERGGGREVLEERKGEDGESGAAGEGVEREEVIDEVE